MVFGFKNKAVDQFVKDANQFFEEIGKQPLDAVRPRQIDPKLQRSLASGTQKGVTLGTKKPIFKVIQGGIVRTKNRSVPLNSKGSGS